MSQQQINRVSVKNYLESAEKMIIKQADAYYIQEHFKVGSDYDSDKFLYAQLYRDAICTDDCEILNWIDRKIRGKLEGKVKLSKDKKIEPNTPDIIINNYYNNEAVYEFVEW